MHIDDIFARGRPTFSFEFFPPRNADAWTGLFAEIRRFTDLSPDFVSVTYGAGGSTREKTHELVVRVREETPLDPIPHLTCVCHTRDEIHRILSAYARHNISNVMALGGDPPRGQECDPGDFPHASDLVQAIVEFNRAGLHPDSRGFGIGVAGFPEGHPATPNRIAELDYLRRKVDAGAHYICTQLFFDNRDFFDFRERCAISGITVPIVAGLMPILSLQSFRRTPELALGARYPAELLRRMQRCSNDQEIAATGMEWTLAQCRELIREGVDGIHFYTLNRSTATEEIFRSLSDVRRGAIS
ncbi:MAG: methylenetetrahydrofolate reductase [NAD(P)H] [Spirochaetaceae bacterium]|nr:MAG: methylenetetrahydrofolate reductase [NAD(P)H] [Spirochaetaceae bacterium]